MDMMDIMYDIVVICRDIEPTIGVYNFRKPPCVIVEIRFRTGWCMKPYQTSLTSSISPSKTTTIS